MRIAFLTTEFVTEPAFAGGLGNYLFRTALVLTQKRGCSPVVIVRSDKDEHLVHQGIDVFRVRPRAPFWVKALDFLTLGRLTGALAQISTSKTLWDKVVEEHRRNKIDFVQAASYDATNLCARRLIPSVVRVSSFEPLWRKAYEKKLTLKQRLIEYFEVRAMKAADGVYAPSRLLAQKVQTAIGRPVSTIEPMYVNDVESPDCSFYEKNLMGKEYFLFFGTIGAMKGCKEIAEIIYPLLRSSAGLYFVFVGATSHEHSKEVKRYILQRAGDVRDRVLFFEPLKHESLYPVIKESSGVILPSRIDNFPNTCIEAMSLGQIVVGTRETSFEQLIDDGVSGFLCNAGDPESLLNTISKLREMTAKQRSSMSVAAIKRIEMLAPDIALCNLIGYYETVIENGKKNRK
jgi:glycosyltransferase involved in cell wall biosynthesis